MAVAISALGWHQQPMEGAAAWAVRSGDSSGPRAASAETGRVVGLAFEVYTRVPSCGSDVPGTFA